MSSRVSDDQTVTLDIYCITLPRPELMIVMPVFNEQDSFRIVNLVCEKGQGYARLRHAGD